MLVCHEVTSFKSYLSLGIVVLLMILNIVSITIVVYTFVKLIINYIRSKSKTRDIKEMSEHVLNEFNDSLDKT